MNKKELLQSMKEKATDAIKNGKTEEFMDELTIGVEKVVSQEIETKLLEKYNDLKESTDRNILASRGVFQLTSEEEKFAQSLVDMAKGEFSTTAKVALPTTTENRVFDNLKVEHPLLQGIDFVNSKGKTEWIITKNLDYAGSWGDLTEAVTQQANGNFVKVQFSNSKLSTFVVVPLTLIELGLTWVNEFVVQYMTEVIARKLEWAIINGTGQKMPVGMIKTVDVENQTVPAKDKTVEALADLTPKSFGAIAKALTDGGKKSVRSVDMICNEADYWEKVYPALNTLNSKGEIQTSNLPLKIYPSTQCPQGKAIFGSLKEYFATIGFGKEGKITTSDHFKFLEDARTFKGVLVAFGTPKDNASFIVKDITNLAEAVITVKQKA